MKNFRCAFHSTQTIVNFCRSSTCFLPMCPLCVKIHTQEHRQEGTYGDYQSIQHVIHNTEHKVRSVESLLASSWMEFTEKFTEKQQIEAEILAKIREAKSKSIALVERLFETIEVSVSRSLYTHNQNIEEDFSRIHQSIEKVKDQLAQAFKDLNNEKCLRTVITFHSEDLLGSWQRRIQQIRNQVADLQQSQVTFRVDYRVLNEAIEKLEGMVHIDVKNQYQGYQGKTKSFGLTSSTMGLTHEKLYS